MALCAISQEAGLNNPRQLEPGWGSTGLEQSSNPHSYFLPAVECPPPALVFAAIRGKRGTTSCDRWGCKRNTAVGTLCGWTLDRKEKSGRIHISAKPSLWKSVKVCVRGEGLYMAWSRNPILYFTYSPTSRMCWNQHASRIHVSD